MKNILSPSEQEMINKFDQELLELLKADLKEYKRNTQTNLIDFNTRRFDLELLALLKEEIAAIRNVGVTALAKVV